MLRIGLTGGLASGKSTVAAHLKELGAIVFDADAIVADLYKPGGRGALTARQLFGDEVLDAEGRVDRARVAAIVFASPRRRHDLEARIHPIVRREIERRFTDARSAGAAVAVAEASQILEARTESEYDRVLLVVAPETERVRRWEADGGDPEDAHRRIATQIRPEAAALRVTDTILNDGSLADLKRKTEEIYQKWVDNS